MPDVSFFTIEKNAESEFADRGSRFLAFASGVQTVEECKIILKNLKEKHPKAVHFCFAYRLGIDNNLFRSTDDGEPSGTAGKPILNQIDSAGVTNVMVVVVRYFGGILLGVPGLINAYKTATADALAKANKIETKVRKRYELAFDYPYLNEVMSFLKQHQITVSEKNLQLFCTIKVQLSESELEKIKELNAAKITAI